MAGTALERADTALAKGAELALSGSALVLFHLVIRRNVVGLLHRVWRHELFGRVVIRGP